MFYYRRGLNQIVFSGSLWICCVMASPLVAQNVGKGGGGGKPNDGGGEDLNYAFVHTVIDKGSLFLTTIDGIETFQLTQTAGRDYDRNPSWSHDLDLQTDGIQSQIAYLRLLDNDDRTYLYVINPDGSGNRLVRSFEWNEPRPEDSNGEDLLVWSPNGKEILFCDNDVSDSRDDQDSGIYAVEVATGNVRTLMGRRFVNGFWDGPARPSISPLGLLAFEFLRNLYTVEFVLDENGLMQIDPQGEWTAITASDPQAVWNEWPVWSPDGTYLAFIDRDRSADPDVTQLIVYDILFDRHIAISEIVSGQRQVTWSADGSEIAVSDITYGKKSSLDIYRITNWGDPELRQFIRVTQSDRDHEVQPHWNPSWIGF